MTYKITLPIEGVVKINGIAEPYTRYYDFSDFNKDGSLSKKDSNYQFALENNLIREVEMRFLDAQIETVKDLGGVKISTLKLADVVSYDILDDYIKQQMELADKETNKKQRYENIKLAIQKVQRLDLKNMGGQKLA